MSGDWGRGTSRTVKEKNTLELPLRATSQNYVAGHEREESLPNAREVGQLNRTWGLQDLASKVMDLGRPPKVGFAGTVLGNVEGGEGRNEWSGKERQLAPDMLGSVDVRKTGV